jgi:hypothetical protein
MNQRQFYVYLLDFLNPNSGETLKVINSAIASTDAAARTQAIEDAIKEHGEHLRGWQVQATGYPMLRAKLEQAAREVLGWEAPK